LKTCNINRLKGKNTQPQSIKKNNHLKFNRGTQLHKGRRKSNKRKRTSQKRNMHADQKSKTNLPLIDDEEERMKKSR